MNIGRRGAAVFLRRAMDRNNYIALARMFIVHRNPMETFMGEILSLGRYPQATSLRTPIGPITARLHNPADLSTLNLIFCRQDYYMPKDAKRVVDIGSNIGLSALFWLSRRPGVRVHCYEPSPVTFARMEENLRPFADSVVLHPDAVSDFAGTANLGIEDSGVYSSLNLAAEKTVECRVRHINEVLETALEGGPGDIDVLKVDNEGHEIRTLKAIAPEFWPRIRCVNVESTEAASIIPQGFHHGRVSSADRFWR